MKTYEIWAEGFKNGPVHATAVCLGKMQAEDFDEACKKLAKENEIFGKYYHPTEHTFWGCKIFKSETKARRKFG